MYLYIYKDGAMTCLHVYTSLINVDMAAIIAVNMWAYDM